MKENDRIRIQHIIDAAQEALSFVRDTDQENFSKNRMMILSVIKEIEIIGEAASKITDETKLKYLDVPWKDIVGMRNRLIHGYFDVDVKIVWNTTRINLPPLVSSLEAILAKDK
jgi:uncharacterized protein with HEPN domain